MAVSPFEIIQTGLRICIIYDGGALDRYPFQRLLHFDSLPMSFGETNFNEAPIFFDQYGTQHNTLDKACNGEVFDGSLCKCSVSYPVNQHVSGCIKKQPELVGLEFVARHAVCPQTFQIFYPKFHQSTPAVAPIDGFGFVIPVGCDHETYVCPLRVDFDFNHHALFIFPRFSFVEEIEVTTYILVPFPEIIFRASFQLLYFLQKGTVTGQSGSETYVAASGVFYPIHKLMAAEVAVTPYFNDSTGPTLFSRRVIVGWEHKSLSDGKRLAIIFSALS